MAETLTALRPGYYQETQAAQAYDADLEPYASLFLKPFSAKKCAFSKIELELMCKDPLHSPRLIRYLIDFVRQL